jgi:hypothetical protein
MRPEPDAAETSERRVVATLTVGERYHRFAEYTHDLMRAYARRCHADFVVLDEDSAAGRDVLWGKMGCHGLLEQYDRLLFLDTDVLVCPGCPDLFEIVPGAQFGAYLVSQYGDFHDEAIRHIQQVLGDLDWKRSYFNSGVLVVPRTHREIFDTSDPDFGRWASVSATSSTNYFYEQTYLNYKLRERAGEGFDIGYQFNHTLASGNSERRFASHMIHCKGHIPGNRLREIQITRRVIENPLLRRLFCWFPVAGRLAPRLFSD